MLQFQPQEHLLHSYIVVSQSEQARERLALDLTAAMLCRSDGVRPCRACRDCRKVYDHVHPDVIYVEPDRSGKTPVIKVDQIRSVAATAYILPSEAEKKVYVLRQAELMNLNAQNAFLKLLEEPPRSAAFILAAASPDSLLTTVRSRCALLRDPTEQPLESEEMRTLADDYLHAVASAGSYGRSCAGVSHTRAWRHRRLRSFCPRCSTGSWSCWRSRGRRFCRRRCARSSCA